MKCGKRIVAKETLAEASRKDAVPESERRQLTVMFCDLVGSTPLSEQLDPEELWEVLRAYQQTCAEVVQRFDGHIAQLLGDALLVYFGWPQAHEDDAQRGVKTGLGMLEAMGTLNARLEKDKGIQLKIRVGIHTGLVVVGEMGGGDHKEQLALGETPNIASRLQGLAEPDTVVLSAATFQLVQGFFTVENLGPQTLKGIPASVQVYRVLGESDAQSRLDVAMTRGLTPLVGREQETGLLLEKWAQVKDGLGQVVLLSGEAGVGKSRLVRVLKNHVSDELYHGWECRSSPYHQNTSLYSITELFHRMLQWHPDDTPDDRLVRLERMLSPYRLSLEETIPLFAPLVSLPISEDQYPPLHLTAQQQRQKTFEALIAILLELAEQQPVLFILEDLHWVDPTTLEFLDLLIDQIQTASIHLLLTYRLEFQPTWNRCSHLTHVRLDRLARGQIERMVTQVAGGKNLPEQLVEQIVEKTDGVPLFVEELTKAVLDSGNLHEVGDHYELTGPLPSLAIPATLQDSLMARLDKLVTAKTIAQCAAVIGRQFSFDLLQAVAKGWSMRN
jgi:class 3 adenylate cyclase